jgi:hypothetical protein
MDGRMDGWTDGRGEKDGTAFRSIDKLMDLGVHGWINRFIEGRMERYMNLILDINIVHMCCSVKWQSIYTRINLDRQVSQCSIEILTGKNERKFC